MAFKSDRNYKTMISILLGLLGFYVNFHALNFAQFPNLKVSILMGLLFPLLIALAWGWKYGLLSALAGGCQSMWWLWKSDGYGFLYAVPVFTLWVVWHGAWSDYRRNREATKWYHGMYAVELLFRVFSELGFYTVFRWLVSLNPPPWAPEVAWTYVDYTWVHFVVVKHIVTAYILLLVSNVLLNIGPVRRFLRLEQRVGQRSTTHIVGASILLGLCLWVIDSVIVYLAFYDGGAPFPDALVSDIAPRDLFVRNLFVLMCLIAGLLVSRFVSHLKRAEEALRRYEHIISVTGEHMSFLDRDYIYRAVNEAYLQAHQKARQEIVGHSVADLLGADVFEQLVKEKMDRCLTGQEIHYQAWFEFPGSGRRYMDVAYYPYVEADGAVSGVVVSSHDTTERVRAEEALRESEEQYRGLFERVPIGLYRSTPEGQILDVNPAMVQMLGYPDRETLLAVNTVELFADPDDRGEEMASLRDDKIMPSFKMQLRRRDGAVIWVRDTFRVARDARGQIIFFEGSLEDITERVRAEEERELLLVQIREQAKRVQQIIDTVPEGVLLLDAAQRVILANPVARGDLAVLADAKVGDTLTRLGDRPLAEFLTSPPDKGLWHEVKVDDRAFEVIARPIESGPEPENWVLVIRDVTQEREVRRQVQRQERLAAVGQLAGGIAHDFNNLMTTIMLYAHMGLGKGEHDLPPNVTRAFETILDEARHAAKLVQQILDFSRRSPIETSPMDLVPFIKEAVRVLERTIPENINFQFDAGPEEYVVDADPTRIQQALMNLVINARDAMPEGGGLHIALSRTAEAEEIRCVGCGQMFKGEWVRVAVADTGTGISPDVLPHIFEPFFTTKAPGEGTGLGLAQVYGIVEQHKGHIDVTTKMEEGTTFHVYLPVSGAQAEITQGQISALPQGQGETILLVEDNEKLLEGGQALLESLGYRVLAGANGREALKVYRAVKGTRPEHSRKVDLVITDLVMPEMGGKRLVQELRKAAPDLKALAITGYIVEKDARELKQAGFLDVVYKPFDVDKLAQIIRRALDEE
ncbi:MAG: hypothetical protein DRJ03_16025 [Chloroflexi bacterium]|nr:MAG: hypothetical protein DRJ03_16025 [Chloroflexota bacterium]